ncbi:hypothetical protein [Paracoccus sp. MKU1]|uniref:hypothetical protein n=1 Tax=Paracoccus sp. MKU1 TaxID=1745182 RepID=UPI00137A1CB4|nr:hypothetical protein [Paracoccus sp. MKU1]
MTPFSVHRTPAAGHHLGLWLEIALALLLCFRPAVLIGALLGIFAAAGKQASLAMSMRAGCGSEKGRGIGPGMAMLAGRNRGFLGDTRDGSRRKARTSSCFP